MLAEQCRRISRIIKIIIIIIESVDNMTINSSPSPFFCLLSHLVEFHCLPHTHTHTHTDTHTHTHTHTDTHTHTHTHTLPPSSPRIFLSITAQINQQLPASVWQFSPSWPASKSDVLDTSSLSCLSDSLSLSLSVCFIPHGRKMSLQIFCIYVAF